MTRGDTRIEARVAGSARQAALVLHSASDADRDWLMAQLPHEHRAQLQPLLEELKQLGLPRDPALLRNALRTSDAAVASKPRTAAERVAAARPQDLARLLAAEPAWLAAQVLAALPVRQRQLVLRQFTAARRGGIGRFFHVAQATPAPAANGLTQAALHEVAARLPTERPQRRWPWQAVMNWRSRSPA